MLFLVWCQELDIIKSDSDAVFASAVINTPGNFPGWVCLSPIGSAMEKPWSDFSSLILSSPYPPLSSAFQVSCSPLCLANSCVLGSGRSSNATHARMQTRTYAHKRYYPCNVRGVSRRCRDRVDLYWHQESIRGNSPCQGPTYTPNTHNGDSAQLSLFLLHIDHKLNK